jgi:wyosine [tRNA(Phe)-imidazoG37] synthetase (radical SAM superfamily)
VEIDTSIPPKYGKPIVGLSGSGEATMAKDLEEYVKAVKSRELVAFMYCNGADSMKNL